MGTREIRILRSRLEERVRVCILMAQGNLGNSDGDGAENCETLFHAFIFEHREIKLERVEYCLCLKNTYTA